MADIKYQVQVETKGGIDNLRNLQEQVKNTNSAFDGLKKLALAAAAAVGTGALISSLKTAMDNVDGLAKSARALGTTTANFQALARSAELAGIGIGELQATAQRLQVNLVNSLEKGTGPAAEALDKLGISARELVKQPIDQQLSKITESLRGIENPAERTALAVELLGKQGPRMLEVADNMNRMRSEMERVGLALSEIDSAAIERAGDSLTELGFLYESIKQKIAAELAPVLIAIAEYIKTSVLEGGNLGKAFTEKVIPAIKAAAQAVAIFVSIVVSAKIVGLFAAAAGAILTMTAAIKQASGAMAIFNAIAGKNPLVRIATIVLGLVSAGAAVYSINEAFSELDEEVKKIQADLAKNVQTMNETESVSGNITTEFSKQRKELEGIVSTYQQSNADFIKRFELQTRLVGATEDQRLEVETLAQVEENYLRTVTDLVKKYQEATSEGKEEIRQALKEISGEYEKQLVTTRQLINNRIVELNVQKERLQLEKELEAATKRREGAEDAVRGIMLDGMDNVRRAMERAELDGLGGIQRALREIEIEENRVATAAKRRVAEQFGDNDPQGLIRALDEIDQASEAIIKRRQESMAAIMDQQRSFTTGWAKAFNQYRDDATNAAKQAERIFQKVTSGMEDMIVNFAKTGKFEFKSFINSILEDLLRSQLRQAMSNVFGLFNGSTSLGGGGGSLFGGFFATGGMIPPGRFGVVGEAGPELVQGPANVTPLGSTNVTYNISAVDAMSFKQMIAQDPSFLYAVTQQGAKGIPTRR
jgi:lambda family phage tail tape measure protein